MNVPVSTVEKPLTPIDYIALLPQLGDLTALGKFATALPPEVAVDPRFSAAFVQRVLEVA